MKIKFGTGRKCINPMVPISLAGYFNVRMWNHIKDDLEVRVVFHNLNLFKFLIIYILN